MARTVARRSWWPGRHQALLPHGFHRIRYYGLFANGGRAENLSRARELLDVPASQEEPDASADTDEAQTLAHRCPCCGGRMIIIETFEPSYTPRAPPAPASTGQCA